MCISYCYLIFEDDNKISSCSVCIIIKFLMTYKDTGSSPFDDQCVANGSPEHSVLFYSIPRLPMKDAAAGGSPTLSEYIPRMTSYERDLWFMDELSTGLASVSEDEFTEYYIPSVPEPELEHALLYAGNESFEELRDYTWDRIDQLFSDVGVADYRYHFPNVNKAFQIVEELMDTMPSRRTGEPSVSHIYRNVLRMIEFIEGYNEIYADRNESPIFTPEIVEFYICATAMHDFLEDYSQIPGVGYHRGGYQKVGKTEFEQWSHGAQFYRAITDTPESQAEDKIHSVTLDFGDYENDMFVSTLLALKSDNVEPGEMMDHLEDTVGELQGRYDQQILQNQLYTLAAYVIKCCDRLDNNATYLFSRTESGELTASAAGRVYNKAQENMVLFDDVLGVLKRIAGHENLSHEEIAQFKPFYLKYDPTRWSKLVLAGVPLNTIYRTNEKGKGIAKIL